MTEQEQRIAIAKACGDVINDVAICPKCKRILSEKQLLEHVIIDCCLDYIHDLNACHEMEEKLNEVEQLYYLQELSQNDVWCPWLSVTATAPQRCEAFLRVKGLWKD